MITLVIVFQPCNTHNVFALYNFAFHLSKDLKNGSKVKLYVPFTGREITYTHISQDDADYQENLNSPTSLVGEIDVNFTRQKNDFFDR